MNHNNIEQQIQEMLDSGASYSIIESTLGVSSKTIARVNKSRKEQKSTEDEGFDQHLTEDFPTEREEPTYFPVTRKQSYPDIRQKFNHTEPRESESSRKESKSDAELRLEELRLRQDHEFRLQQFEWVKEKEEKELRLKEQEVNQKQAALDLKQSRTSEKYREYIFKLKNIANQCQPGTWDYDDLIDLYNYAEKLYEKIEKFYIVHEMDFENSLNKQILEAICETLAELIDQNEGEEEVEWNFDDQFEELMDLAGKL